MMRHSGKHRHAIIMLKENIQKYKIWHVQYIEYKYT